MSYSKVPKQVTDGPVGYQSINLLNTNLDDTRALYGVNHGLASGSGGYWGALGVHSDMSLSKSVLHLVWSTAEAFQVFSYIATSPGISSFSHVSTGYVRVDVAGLKNVRAKVTGALASTTEQMIHRVHRSLPISSPYIRGGGASSQASASFHVYLYRRNTSSGYFELYNASFSMAVWGEPI